MMLKFWSDDFDMDLLKVYPSVVDALGATADIKLWTLSHATHGRINCPVSWNTYQGLRSFLWLENLYLDLARDKNGWINIDGYVCNEAVMECTWLEWLRDMWAHQHNWLLIPSGNIANVERGGVRFAGMEWHPFEQIMWHKRGWNKSLTDAGLSLEPDVKPIDQAVRAGMLWLTKANRKFARAVEMARLGKEDYPYFAPGSQTKQHEGSFSIFGTTAGETAAKIGWVSN